MALACANAHTLCKFHTTALHVRNDAASGAPLHPPLWGWNKLLPKIQVQCRLAPSIPPTHPADFPYPMPVPVLPVATQAFAEALFPKVKEPATAGTK